MNIISLNTWCGRRFDALKEFVVRQSREVDVFCLQEVIIGGPHAYIAGGKARGAEYEELVSALPDFQAYHAISAATSPFIQELLDARAQGDGLALLINKKHTILASGSMPLYDGDPFALTPSRAGADTGQILWARIQDSHGKQYLVATVHGLFLDMRDPSPAKGDTSERIEQSRRILDFIKQQNCPSVVIGDFNLRPETKSIAMLSGDMRNLITEYGITNTRNVEYADMEKYKDYIADYAFVSKEVQVKNFTVLPDVVSDHAPLLLELH